MLVLDYLARMTGEKLYFQTIVRDAEAAGDLVIPDDITADRYDLFDDPGFPRMCFVEKDLEGGYNNWFVCNTSAVYGILRSSGFTNITRAGGDCFVCEPAGPGARTKVSHGLTGIRT